MSADGPVAPTWRVCADATALATEAAAAVAGFAERSIRTRGSFRIALAGGTTPLGLYRRLAALPADWERWHVYFSDERCVPAGEPARNDRMATEAWLAHVPIPASQVHPIPAELGALAGASAYAAEVRRAGRLDLVLLGVGEDGHTASLFPGMDQGNSTNAALALPVHAAPKPPAERVSLSLRAINAARWIIVLADGQGKRDAIAKWHSGADLPVARLAPAETLIVFLGESAVPAAMSRARR